MFKKKSSEGFTLIELMIVMSIVAVSLIAYGASQVLANQKMLAVGAANHIKIVGEAAKAYLKYNKPALDASGTSTTTVPFASLQVVTSCGIATPCLPANIKSSNFWGANFNITIKRTGSASPYSYELLVITVAGTGPAAYTVNGKRLVSVVSYAASVVGNGVGFTASKGGPQRAWGPGGEWSVLVGGWSAIETLAVNPVGGQLAYYFTEVGAPYDSIYLRTDGSNAMGANLNMGGKGIYGVGYGINNTGVTAAGSTGTNEIITSGLTVNGTSTLAGNTNVTSGNLVATNNVVANGTLTVAGTSTLNSSLTVNGAATVTSDISTSGNVNLTNSTGDVKMASLLTGHTSNSVKDMMPNLVEVASFLVGDGTAIASPTCGSGGAPRIFVIPSSAVMPIYAGNAGYIFSAIGPASGPWTVNAKDSAGNPLPGASIALARTFCAF